jgi:hypothetical protein
MLAGMSFFFFFHSLVIAPVTTAARHMNRYKNSWITPNTVLEDNTNGLEEYQPLQNY